MSDLHLACHPTCALCGKTIQDFENEDDFAIESPTGAFVCKECVFAIITLVTDEEANQAAKASNLPLN